MANKNPDRMDFPRQFSWWVNLCIVPSSWEHVLCWYFALYKMRIFSWKNTCYVIFFTSVSWWYVPVGNKQSLQLLQSTYCVDGGVSESQSMLICLLEEITTSFHLWLHKPLFTVLKQRSSMITLNFRNFSF